MIKEIEALRLELLEKVLEITGIDPKWAIVDVKLHNQELTAEIVKDVKSYPNINYDSMDSSYWYETTNENGGDTVVFFNGEI